MQAELINPFIESVQEIFSTMLSSNATRGQISVSRDSKGPGELLALIGISGESKGTVTVSFPTDTALQIVGQMAGMEFEAVDETVVDGVAELINMIAGGAKAKLRTNGKKPMDLGLPSVVTGKDYHVDYPKKSIWLEVPFESDLGSFLMRVTFESGGPLG
jgi:chemotaxis protein CheX